jgi:hypothetical protein
MQVLEYNLSRSQYYPPADASLFHRAAAARSSLMNVRLNETSDPWAIAATPHQLSSIHPSSPCVK